MWDLKSALYGESRGKWKKEADHSDGPVAGIISKRTYTQGLSWMPQEESIFALAHNVLKALIRFGHTYDPRGLKMTLLVQGCIFGAISGAEKTNWMHITWTRERLRVYGVLDPLQGSTSSNIFSMTTPNDNIFQGLNDAPLMISPQHSTSHDLFQFHMPFSSAVCPASSARSSSSMEVAPLEAVWLPWR